MSQKSPDGDARFSELLQPIRDLTKNWEIDIASQLEEYLSEIETFRISFDGGATSMNFAEAALLIQGSACIYSKKVEYLYSLVFQTLDLLASKKKLLQGSSVDPQGKDKDVSQFEQNQEAFLSLDDFPENKKANEVHPDKEDYDENENVNPKAEFALLKLDDMDRGTPIINRKGEVLGYKRDFNVDATFMHYSGMQLLGPGKFSSEELAILAKQSSTPLHSAQAPTLNTNEEEGLIPDIPLSDFGDDAHDISADDVAMGDILDDSLDAKLKVDKEECEKREMRPRLVNLKPKPVKEVPDPWKLLDPHDPAGYPIKPFKKGNTIKLPPSLARARGKGKKRKKAPEKPQLMPIAEFISKAFYSHEKKLPTNPLKLPSLPEFYNLYYPAFKKQQNTLRKLKTSLMEQGRYEELEEVEQEEADDFKQEPLPDYNDDDDFEFGAPDFPPEESVVHAIESSQKEVVSTYEDLVRQHVSVVSEVTFDIKEDYSHLLSIFVTYVTPRREQFKENYLAGAQEYAQVTALSQRVSQWEDKITPILKREEEFGFFDIHDYGTIVLENLEKKAAEQRAEKVRFAEVVEENESFDISRLFLATLQLANTYNVEIHSKGVGAVGMDTMSLKLLSKRRHHEDMAEYRAPSADTNQLTK